MRNFNQRFRLRDSDRHIRLLYTLFLLLMLAGFLFSFFWAHSMTGLSPSGIADHYRGSDATFGEPMSFRELAEVTHFHLFTMPVVFMILVHVMYPHQCQPCLEGCPDLVRIRRRHSRSHLAVADQLCLPRLRVDHAHGGHPHDAQLLRHDGCATV